jgi:hypothetical protein
MNDKCPNCLNDIVTEPVVLNIFNIANIDVRGTHFYCSGKCIEERIMKIKDGMAGDPLFSPQSIVGLMKSKTGDYAVIIDY